MDLQRSLAARAVVAVALLCAQGLVAPKAHAAYMLAPGWTIERYATLNDYVGDGVAVDGMGNLYVCGNSGISRVDTAGAVSLWSRCVGDGLAVLPDGEAYVPSRDILGNGLSYLWHVAPDGSYTPFAARTSGSGWTWAAVTASGKLYANVWAGDGEGLFAIDINTGDTPSWSGVVPARAAKASTRTWSRGATRSSSPRTTGPKAAFFASMARRWICSRRRGCRSVAVPMPCMETRGRNALLAAPVTSATCGRPPRGPSPTSLRGSASSTA